MDNVKEFCEKYGFAYNDNVNPYHFLSHQQIFETEDLTITVEPLRLDRQQVNLKVLVNYKGFEHNTNVGTLLQVPDYLPDNHKEISDERLFYLYRTLSGFVSALIEIYQEDDHKLPF